MRLLLPQKPSEWRQPSQRTSTFGIENQTRFRLTARANDGAIFWRGWFDDRDDADEFLWAMVRGQLPYERDIWKLPVPQWHPDLDPGLTYDFVTVTFLTDAAGAPSTFATPADWSNSNNTIEIVAGGGYGGSGYSAQVGSGGAGGGAYSKKNNVSISGLITYQVGGSSGAVSNSWFAGTGLGAALCSAQGGSDGTYQYSGSGGDAAVGIGDLKYSGGTSGYRYNGGGTGGGGAAGPNGPGGPGGGSDPGTAIGGGGGGGSNGGYGGAQGLYGGGYGYGGNNRDNLGGSGGAAQAATLGGGGCGGAYFGYAAAQNGNAGGDGIEWDANHGCGGGGGGGGDGGDYNSYPNYQLGGFSQTGGKFGGGASGAGGGSYSGSGGYGMQGLIVVIYTPQAKVSGFNMPMMGM